MKLLRVRCELLGPEDVPDYFLVHKLPGSRSGGHDEARAIANVSIWSPIGDAIEEFLATVLRLR